METEMRENSKMENRAIQGMKKKQLMDLIGHLADGIQKRHDEAKGLTIEIQAQHDKANSLSGETQKRHDEAKGLTIEIQAQHDKANSLSGETQKRHDEAKGLTIEIQAQHDKANSLSGETQKRHDEAKRLTTEIQGQCDKTSNLIDVIQKQHNDITQIIEGKKEELEKLTKQIEGLLPGATSAGLASSYHDAWKEKNTAWYWIGFISSLVVLVAGYFYWIYTIQNIQWLDVIVRAIVGAPLIWIAWYCQKSISQTNRVKEEYHHKQRIMSVFEGFSKQIDEFTKDDPEQNKVKKLELISVIISAIGKNPSEILDPSETFLDSLKNEKKIGQIKEELNKVLGAKKNEN